MSNPGNAPATNSGNGIAVGSLVLGIVGVVFSFLFVWVGLIASIIGLVLGFVARRRNAGTRGMVLAGIILSVIGLVLSIIFIIVALTIVVPAMNN
ncbi:MULTISPECIES: DUF4190 domain-containing protein [Curtobacterium]|jgi:hypothetical protein|uniref:DUF4190 domain-containing protein n=2 Tax=Curtobacterium TaxID=2034 RepID=A0A9Q2W675_9MICO|nr:MULTISPECIES: DUF4190 domain-containing protein [Curtobacterium]EYT66710.1 hypothetical protein H489_0101230 [Curtobacterium flaccumfaciens UCD-AKU]MBT1543145.1 hypothetical protein [Curtobacterium flaccumfaciens pv. flaccumfaciens]MBT1597569.1 hypothetical protein [Curtobacterium flaccumfaciens pv. flaccumfaciens]MBT1611134.1 hypothetical protein [Curtobacterium flaccumfaciens pv. poinsettiae]MCS0646146.1 DUF4190 domain-containing protein [Curtobacterium flaccumfaciens pv. flaccumfaciens]